VKYYGLEWGVEDKGWGREGNYQLYRVKGNVIHILLNCSNTMRRRKKFFNRKCRAMIWLRIGTGGGLL
jgi:hypothetical protein